MNKCRHLLLSCAKLAAQSSGRAWGTSGASLGVSAAAAVNVEGFKSTSSLWLRSTRGLHSSFSCRDDGDIEPYSAPTFYEPERKYRPLGDKELWHESWMYEDRFGSETSPINVPSLEDERIIGVTDPEDEGLVVWGILKADEPPRQFIENGEYYVLTVVAQVKKVGDVLLELESGEKPPLAP